MFLLWLDTNPKYSKLNPTMATSRSLQRVFDSVPRAALVERLKFHWIFFYCKFSRTTQQGQLIWIFKLKSWARKRKIMWRRLRWASVLSCKYVSYTLAEVQGHVIIITMSFSPTRAKIACICTFQASWFSAHAPAFQLLFSSYSVSHCTSPKITLIE